MVVSSEMVVTKSSRSDLKAFHIVSGSDRYDAEDINVVDRGL
jgi:hypothetical protein